MVSELPMIGWREWLALPDLGVDRIKAKVDTGARTSSLHAFDVHVDTRHSRVRFKLHPIQRSTHETFECEAPLVDRRWVRSSNGKRELRPVIETSVGLLGREAIRRRFLVNAGRSFLASRRNKKKKRSKRKS